MKIIIYLATILFVTLCGYCQEQPIDISYTKINNGYIIKAKNKSSQRNTMRIYYS